MIVDQRRYAEKQAAAPATVITMGRYRDRAEVVEAMRARRGESRSYGGCSCGRC